MEHLAQLLHRHSHLEMEVGHRIAVAAGRRIAVAAGRMTAAEAEVGRKTVGWNVELRHKVRPLLLLLLLLLLLELLQASMRVPWCDLTWCYSCYEDLGGQSVVYTDGSYPTALAHAPSEDGEPRGSRTNSIKIIHKTLML
jgi:hypothetical protein